MAHVELPDQVWGRLATAAAHRDVTIPDLLVAAITEVLKPRNRAEHVLFLAHAGYTDRRICEATGEVRAYVAKVRQAAGLPANRQRRTDTEGIAA